jgi:hypothetical protein
VSTEKTPLQAIIFVILENYVRIRALQRHLGKTRKKMAAEGKRRASRRLSSAAILFGSSFS